MALGFYFDSNACIGCKTCEITCKEKWDQLPGVAFREVRSFEVGIYPNASVFHYSGSCNHCKSPACVANCPQGAMYIADDETVQHDDTKCIGCGACANSCPYGVPKVFGEPLRAGKCNACAERREKGLEPACVEACHMRCLEFGDVDELKAKHGDLGLALPFMPEQTITNPRTMVNIAERVNSSDMVEKSF